MKISSNKSLIREIAPGTFAIGNNPFAPAFLLDANTQKASVSGVEVVLDGDLQHLFDNLDLVDAQHSADISINATGISVEITRATAAEAAIQADVSQNTTKLQGVEDGATADQTDAEIKVAYEANADTNEFSDAEQSKLQGIEAGSNNYSHPDHSGEVTSTADGVTVISDDVVDGDNLKTSNAPANGHVLTAQSGAAGGLAWAAPNAGGGLSEEEVKAIAFRFSIIFG